MSSLIDKAVGMAHQAHIGQTDKAGRPYILHALRLMLKFDTEAEMIVAVLHDVIEDSDVTLEHLKESGYPSPVIAAIDCLTRRKDESYDDFIKRIKTNSLARKVKIADLMDNLDLTRLVVLTEQDLLRINKYHKALQILLN